MSRSSRFPDLKSSPSSSSHSYPQSSPGRAARSPLQRNSEPVQANRNATPSSDLAENDSPGQARSKRRRANRHSGGFLLDSGAFGSHQGASKRRSPQSGKAAARVLDFGEHPPRQTERSGGGINKATNERHPPVSQAGASSVQDAAIQPTALQTSLAASHERPDHQSTAPTWNQTASSTFDSDPAQIVSLALNLSESRRQFSAGRISSLDSAGHRIISNPQGTSLATAVSSGLERNSRNQLDHQRNGFNGKGETPEAPDYFLAAQRQEQAGTDAQQVPLLPGIDFGATANRQFSPSSATLARAEKAKVAIELGFQHRRLLQYVPRLPTPQGNRPATAKGGSRSTSENSTPLGRVYNPLQYLRNRRVRVHESKPLNSEADGWKDVERVTTWVDAVATEREERVSKIDDEYPLPPYTDGRPEVRLDNSYLAANAGNSNAQSLAKQPRQRTDWSITPWDLLGDVYWLSQDDNKYLIEDRHGEKLYKSRNNFDTPQMRLNSARPISRRSVSIARVSKLKSEDAQLPKNNATVESVGERGRKQYQRDAFRSGLDYSSSRERRSKWPRKLIRAQSLSSSENSDRGSAQGLPRLRGRPTSREIQATALLERQVRELLAQEEANAGEDAMKAEPYHFKSSSASAVSSRHPSVERANEKALAAVNADVKLKDSSGRTLPHERGGSQKPGHKAAQSMDYLDSSALNSPGNRSVVPSIAINLSPPSRLSSVSDGRRSLPRNSIMGEFDKELYKVETIDFASARQSHVPGSSEVPSELKDDHMGGLLSPRGKGGYSKTEQEAPERNDRIHPTAHKEPRLRGLFKGSRLADAVSGHVSRVRDLTGRKEETDQSAPQSPISTYPSDVENTDDDKRRPPGFSRAVTRVSTQSTEQVPKQHLDNLPVFKSPFRNEGHSESTSAGQDHISRQQNILRSKRSWRFDKLAPPSLDMRSISSPEPSPPRTPTDNKRGYGSDGLHRRSGPDRRFAVVEGPLDGEGRRGYPVTGKEDATIAAGSPDQWSHGDHLFTVADLNLQLSKVGVTSSQVARLGALSLSTSTKVNGLIRCYNSVRKPPLSLLEALWKYSENSINQVTRKEEPAEICRLLVLAIDENNMATRAAVNAFSSSTVNELHEHLRELEIRISNDMTGLVRAAADRADDLGSELATADTLNVKRLNESIDLIMRRRRRRFRNLRRGLYLLLEWTLLGLMWWVWLVFVVVRLLRGFLYGIYRVCRWLLWL